MAFSDPTLTHCMRCGAPSETWAVTYHQNIGVIAAHWRSSHDLQVCKSCLHKEYWKRFAILITIGWTSYYSIIIGPVLLITNTVNYIGALRKPPTALPTKHDGPAPQYLPPSL